MDSVYPLSDSQLLDCYKLGLDVHSIVAITDMNGIIQYVNAAFCSISKFTQEELIGKSHKIINSGYHSKIFFKEMWETISVGKIWKGDIKNREKGGGFYWVRTSIVPIKNRAGVIKQFVSIRTDITETVQIKEKYLLANKKLQQLTEELKIEKQTLHNKNIALNELITHIGQEKSLLKETISKNLETVIFPLLETMKLSGHHFERKYLDLVCQNLEEIASPFIDENKSLIAKLTLKELQICNMIKNGLAVKDIAKMLHLSPRTIDKHRENIRSKLGLKTKKVNLASFLLNNLGSELRH